MRIAYTCDLEMPQSNNEFWIYAECKLTYFTNGAEQDKICAMFGDDVTSESLHHAMDYNVGTPATLTETPFW